MGLVSFLLPHLLTVALLLFITSLLPTSLPTPPMDLSSRLTSTPTSCTNTGTTTTPESQELTKDWIMKCSQVITKGTDLSQSHQNQIRCFTSHPLHKEPTMATID